jgi:hypothetical protein
LKANKEDVKWTYRKLRELRPVSMVDSNYARYTIDWRNVSGNLHTLGGAIVGWLSKTHNLVTLSVTEAEYISTSTGGQEIVFLTMLLRECDIEVNLPGILLEDNTGAIILIKNQQIGVRTKHIDVRWAALVARKARRRNHPRSCVHEIGKQRKRYSNKKHHCKFAYETCGKHARRVFVRV